MSRRRWIGAASAVALLGGCREDQAAQTLWVSLPVALVLVVGPVALLVVVARATGRWAGRRPAGPGVDWRHVLVALPVVGAVGSVAVVWGILVGFVAVGYRDPHEDFLSWGDVVVLAGLAAVALVASGALGLALGLGIGRERRWALVVVGLVGLGALVGQIRLVLMPGQGAAAWWVLAAEALYLLVLGSLRGDGRRVTAA